MTVGYNKKYDMRKSSGLVTVSNVLFKAPQRADQLLCFIQFYFIKHSAFSRLSTYFFQVFVTFEGRIGSAKIRRFEELHITLGSRGSSTGKSSRRLGLGCRAFISVFRIAQINGSFLISDLLLYILIGFESVSFKSRFTS